MYSPLTTKEAVSLYISYKIKLFILFLVLNSVKVECEHKNIKEKILWQINVTWKRISSQYNTVLKSKYQRGVTQVFMSQGQVTDSHNISFCRFFVNYNPQKMIAMTCTFVEICVSKYNFISSVNPFGFAENNVFTNSRIILTSCQVRNDTILKTLTLVTIGFYFCFNQII